MSVGIHAFVSDPNHPLICGYCSREKDNETYHGLTTETKLKQEPVADGGGMQLPVDVILAGQSLWKQEKDRAEKAEAELASSQEALRAARELNDKRFHQLADMSTRALLAENRIENASERMQQAVALIDGIPDHTGCIHKAKVLLSPEGSSR